MPTNLPLLLVQCICFTTTLVLALVLAMSRPLMGSEPPSKSYETSRWLLCLAFILYAIHYLLQMRYGFRAQGEDVGALFNIIFYHPIAVLLASATLFLSADRQYLKLFIQIGIATCVVDWSIAGAGIYYYGGYHIAMALIAMEVVYVLSILFVVIFPIRAIRRGYRRIEAETANSNIEYNLYTRASTILLYTIGGLSALSIFSTTLVMAVAAFFLLAVIFYVVCFVSLGASIQSLSSIIDESSDSNNATAEADQPTDQATAPSTAPADHLTPEQVKKISEAIATWRAKHGYSTINLTSVTMAQRLGIPKRQLTQYLAQCEGNTFRVWLSNLRIEEAKRMLTDTNYGIEAICEACGFSSRSWMTEKFKASTGMTPGDWRENRKKRS